MRASNSDVFRTPEALGYELEPVEVAQNKVGERLERALARAMKSGSFIRVQVGSKGLFPTCTSALDQHKTCDQLVVILDRVTVVVTIRDLDDAWLILARALEFEERAPAEARLNNSHIIGGA